jgi:hypothetical protein
VAFCDRACAGAFRTELGGRIGLAGYGNASSEPHFDRKTLAKSFLYTFLAARHGNGQEQIIEPEFVF